MTLRYVLPVPPEPKADVAGATPHAWKPLPANPVLGLIDNGKTRARDLLLGVATLLEKQGLIDSHFILRKPTAAHTITMEDRVDLRARAHLIISAIGD
ncbi:MAG: hypothetical protein FJY55_12145 [Betaproteobacteria bacterium]|nr:hypothetical protein [Betaproteobacteria bacterium]